MTCGTTTAPEWFSATLVLFIVILAPRGYAAEETTGPPGPLDSKESHPADDGGDEVRRDVARRLAYAAMREFEAQRYDRAIERAERAFAMVPASTIALLLGRAHKERGEFRLSALWFKTAKTPSGLADNRVLRDARRQAELELDILERQFPRVRVEPGDHNVSAAFLDGSQVSAAAANHWFRVDPGRHSIELEFESGATLRQVFDIAPGQHRMLVVSGAAGKPRAVSGAWRSAGIATLGVGAVALGAGVGFALHAQAIDRRLADECLDHSCPPSEEEDVRAHSTARAISTASYLLGAVATTGGALMLWKGSKESPAHDVQVVVSHDRVTLKGAF